MRRIFVHRIASYRSVVPAWLFGCVLLGVLLSSALAQPSPSAPEPKPAARIDLSAIGYRAPSLSDRLSEDDSIVSLNFFDATHVLLTFNRKGLLQRLPSCPPDHQDRLMHGAILEVPSGKVVKEADWYLHDRRRYLWPLGQGKFLLRKLNDLFLLDSSLHEKLLLSSPKNLLWVNVTPDASQIVVETAAPTSAAKDSSPSSPSRREPKFVARFFDVTTLALQRTVPLDQVVNLNGTSAGYADLVHKGDIWLVRFGPTPARRRNIARVHSQTTPDVFYSSNHSLLVGRCALRNCDYGVTAFTLTGHRLWRQHWTRYRMHPSVVRSQDESRFGVSTLQLAVAPAVRLGSLLDDQDENQLDTSHMEVFRQQIQIFETASGNPVLSVDIAPSVQSGQNFSLSPDGLHLAVLQGASIELFDLPPISDEERSKFSALRSDVSDLYTVASASDSSASSPDSPSDDSTGSADPADAPADQAAPETNANNSAPTGDTSNPDSANPDIPSAPAAATTTTNSAAPASVGKTPTNTDAVTTIRVSAKSVVVDVVVTDSKGHPVKGLPSKDFQMAEDGKPQDLRSFREFTAPDGEAAAPPSPGQSASPANSAPSSPNVFSNNTQAAEPGAVTMILFDLLNTPSQDQVFAREQLIKFLQSKPKGSQLALSTMSNGATHLRLLQGFTADETLLLSAARSKKGAPKAVRWQVAESGTGQSVDTVAVLAQEGQTSGFQGLLSALQGMQGKEEESDTNDRAGITLDSMMQLATYLSGIPGRKNIVWLSGSFPVALSAIANSGDHSLDNLNFSSKIKLVTNLLADAQIAVYPVDVRGLMGGGPGADSAALMSQQPLPDTPSFRGQGIIAPAPSVPANLQALAREADERDTLNQFAIATGGKAFYSSNAISQAIETSVEQGSNYYTLSYVPANKLYDGKFRKIKVSLAAKGYSLHYRQGYFADDAHTAAREAELARRTRSVAMQHGSPPSRQLHFSVRVVPVGGKKKIELAKLANVLTPSKTTDPPAQVEIQHYSIDYTFAGSELRFVPLPNADYRNVLMLMATSFDHEGEPLNDFSNIGTSDLPPDLYKKVIDGDFAVHQETDVPVEATWLRLGLQDQMNNHLGTVEIALPVPAAPESARRIRNPLPAIEPD